MDNSPKNVVSNQQGVHENLDKIIQRHLKAPYKKPVQNHNKEAFEQFILAIENRDKNQLILDSCCGTGMSSLRLAVLYPEHFVLAIDQSAHRLQKQSNAECLPKNLLFLRANCEDFWRLCVAQHIRFSHHFIFYPNPWPKSQHFSRRWHGHPVFPVLCELSDRLQLRSNWRIYLEEFAVSWKLLTKNEGRVTAFCPDDPITLFEKKYHEASQSLFKLELDIA